MPYIKKRLADDLKIKVDSSVDPLTVVAHGACIFGMGQKIPDKIFKKQTKKDDKIKNKVELHYTPLTSDSEESVTGKISGLDSKNQYYIKIQSDSGTFTGPKTKINNGKFFYTVNVEPKKQNLYWIYLFDEKNKPVKISPDSFTITHGLSVSGAPIPHSISVVVAVQDFETNQQMNKCDKIFEKGSMLPLKKTIDIYKTARKLKKGEDGTLDIEVVEGESEILDRNTYVCQTGFKGKDLPHDLPAGTPLELSIEVNESREVSITAYIPLIDVTLNARSTLMDEKIESNELSSDLDLQRERAAVVMENCSDEESKKISDDIQTVSKSVENSSNDEDEKRKANKQLKDLKQLLDKFEKEKAFPQLVKEYNELTKNIEKIINEYAAKEEKKELEERFKEIKQEVDKAIEKKDKTLIVRNLEQLYELRNQALFSNPEMWIVQFKDIAQNGKFTNEKEAQYFIGKGVRAIEEEDMEELKRCTHELYLLLTIEEQQKSSLSGITR